MTGLIQEFLRIYSRSDLRGSYRLTKFLSHRLRSLQCIPIQTDSGVLYADLRIPSSRGILANPRSESGEDAAMQKVVRKGDVVFDIGAHLGLYTLLLSELVGDNGRVHSFEPNAELLPMLRLTIERLSNVELHSFALSDRTGSVDLFVPEDPTMASLADWTDGVVGEVHHVSCKMERLDDLVEGGQLPVPQFIKCDVEGAEISVFSGALKTLDREDAPILMFELNAKAAKAFGKTTTDYFELLGSLSSAAYSFYDILKDRVSKLEVTDLEYTNILAIPAARSDAVEGLLG